MGLHGDLAVQSRTAVEVTYDRDPPMMQGRHKKGFVGTCEAVAHLEEDKESTKGMREKAQEKLPPEDGEVKVRGVILGNQWRSLSQGEVLGRSPKDKEEWLRCDDQNGGQRSVVYEM